MGFLLSLKSELPQGKSRSMSAILTGKVDVNRCYYDRKAEVKCIPINRLLKIENTGKH